MAHLIYKDKRSEIEAPVGFRTASTLLLILAPSSAASIQDSLKYVGSIACGIPVSISAITIILGVLGGDANGVDLAPTSTPELVLVLEFVSEPKLESELEDVLELQPETWVLMTTPAVEGSSCKGTVTDDMGV